MIAECQCLDARAGCGMRIAFPGSARVRPSRGFSAIPTPASSPSPGGQKNGGRDLRPGAAWVVRPPAAPRPRPGLRRPAHLPRRRGAARGLSALWHGEAGAARLPGGQSPRPSDTGAGAGRGPGQGGVTMMRGLAPRTEGRRGPQRRLGEGGRYLGIPRNGRLAARSDGSEYADDHNCSLLSVQKTGCGTTRSQPQGSRRRFSRPEVQRAEPHVGVHRKPGGDNKVAKARTTASGET
jgi:hypothetical protein